MDVDHLVARASSDRLLQETLRPLQASVRQQESMIGDQEARLRILEALVARALDSPATPVAAGAPTAVAQVEARHTVPALCTVRSSEWDCTTLSLALPPMHQAGLVPF